MGRHRSTSFYLLSIAFLLFVLFLYGPMICVYVLSFQGPTGGTSFPMRGVSLEWYKTLFEGGRGVGDLGNAFWRSMRMCFIVAGLTCVISVAAGMAYRRKFFGRFNPYYEEAATDLGATSRQRFLYVILPIVLPGVIGITMAGFTSSYDESARSALNMGTGNTMPMELSALLGAATTPAMFAVGTLTTLFMFTLVIVTLIVITRIANRRQVRLNASA